MYSSLIFTLFIFSWSSMLACPTPTDTVPSSQAQRISNVKTRQVIDSTSSSSLSHLSHYPYKSAFFGDMWWVWDGWVPRCREDLFPDARSESLTKAYNRSFRESYTRNDLNYDVVVEIVAGPKARVGAVLQRYDWITQKKGVNGHKPDRIPERNYIEELDACNSNGPWPRTEGYYLYDYNLTTSFLFLVLWKLDQSPPQSATQDDRVANSTTRNPEANHQLTMAPSQISSTALRSAFFSKAIQGTLQSSRRHSRKKPISRWIRGWFRSGACVAEDNVGSIDNPILRMGPIN